LRCFEEEESTFFCEAPTPDQLKHIPNIDYFSVRSCDRTIACQPTCNPGFYSYDLTAVCFGPVWDISGSCLANTCRKPTEDEADKQVPNLNYNTVSKCDGKSKCEPECIKGYTAEDLTATCKENTAE